MKRLASAISLTLIFSLASCGDDDKPAVDGGGGTGGTVDTGTSPGVDGSTSTTCTGSFAGVTQTQLAGAIAMSSGAKSCAPDVALVCTANIAQIAGACGVSCVGMGKPCITACIKGQLATLSDACGGCYADTVLCAQMNCLTQCLNNPAAAECTQCQIDKGCRRDFAACSGLPVAPAGDGGVAGDGGGAGDGGVTDAAAGDGGGTDAPGVDGGAADTAAADTAAADTAVSTDSSTD